jgi:hypothetical protein
MTCPTCGAASSGNITCATCRYEMRLKSPHLSEWLDRIDEANPPLAMPVGVEEIEAFMRRLDAVNGELQ